VEKLDPKKQLREAGYPFSHIGTELIHLDAKFEVVSKDYLLLKTDFEKRASELDDKIGKDTASVHVGGESCKTELAWCHSTQRGRAPILGAGFSQTS
jgi:hypothetical protein